MRTGTVDSLFPYKIIIFSIAKIVQFFMNSILLELRPKVNTSAVVVKKTHKTYRLQFVVIGSLRK